MSFVASVVCKNAKKTTASKNPDNSKVKTKDNNYSIMKEEKGGSEFGSQETTGKQGKIKIKTLDLHFFGSQINEIINLKFCIII